MKPSNKRITNLGKPGKFSTSEVFINWPPAWYPANRRGFKLALPTYTPAVYPLGPLPMMMEFQTAEKAFERRGRTKKSKKSKIKIKKTLLAR